MGSDELTKWMAFTELQNEDYRKKLEAVVAQEDQNKMTEEQLAEQMRNMFLGLKGNGDNGRD